MTSKPNPIRDEYLSHIEKQKQSRLSIKKYCEENNLVEHKFSYYRSYQLKVKKQSKLPAFAQVKIKSPCVSKGTINIDPIWLAEFLNNLLVKK